MQKSTNRKKAGFSLAEVLIVIAIIGILSAVSFVGIIGYLRTLEKLKYDGYAKEIFIAAQNHLTMVESLGYLRNATNDHLGTKVTIGEEKFEGQYYFIVQEGTVTPGNNRLGSSNLMIDYMLPVASVDDTIRLGGNYLIRYNKNSGQILEVYYWEENGRYKYSGNGADLLGAAQEPDVDLSNYGEEKSVIGYYDGKGLEKGDPIETPKIRVSNSDTLKVTVTFEDSSVSFNSSAQDNQLDLILTGETSGAETAVNFGGRQSGKYSYSIVLDDITTSGKSFSVQFRSKGFIPGENIFVQAKAYNNTKLTPISLSVKRKTNSLFAKIEKAPGDTDSKSINGGIATVKNIRHLENLSDAVSGVNAPLNRSSLQTDNSRTAAISRANATQQAATRSVDSNVTVTIAKAIQKSDISWTAFKKGITGQATGAVSIYYNGGSNHTNISFYPVSTSYALEYDGNCHAISDVVIDWDGNAGLFDVLQSGESASDPVDSISNLKLVNFNVKGSTFTPQNGNPIVPGSAGALAGNVDGGTVSNVIAVNQYKDTSGTGTLTTGINGAVSAGGLIGALTSGSIEKSAAAMIVTSENGAAGGLVGIATGGSITACYSGGHTGGYGSYFTFEENKPPAPLNNVTGATAGGLVGNSSADISYSYSTCSVSGAISGGLVGSLTGGSVSNCYATGRIDYALDNNNEPVLSNKGAFIGTLSAGTVSQNQYFEIINEILNSKGEYSYLGPVNNGTDNNITPLDEMYGYYYTGETGTPDNQKDWATALAYDPTLVYVYQGQYPLQTVEQLAGTHVTFADKDFVKVHYGDWPAPETWVINQ